MARPLRARGHLTREQQHRQHSEDEHKQDLLDEHIPESDGHSHFSRIGRQVVSTDHALDYQQL